VAGGEGNFDAGDDGRPLRHEEGVKVGDTCRTGVVGANSFSFGMREALSKKSANRPSLECQCVHSSLETNRLYRTLLKNSTSIM
jgi:hypothetical protein